MARARWRALDVPRSVDSEGMRMLRLFIREHGIDRVAAALNVSKPTIYVWSKLGRVPKKYDEVERIGWARMAAREIGVSAAEERLGVTINGKN